MPGRSGIAKMTDSPIVFACFDAWRAPDLSGLVAADVTATGPLGHSATRPAS